MYTIQKHLQFNAWANGKVVEILSNVDENLFTKEVKSSFPTLNKTILHIWDAEQIWFTRLQGGSPSTWPSANFNGTVREMLTSFVQNSTDLAVFMANKDRAFLDSKITYKNMKGLEFTQPVEDILFHVVNHASFHRGQLITMLRELGFDKFVSQDLIAYLRLQG